MENYFWIEIRGKMKKSDLKRLIKPIVKECINEALVEQGLLSNIISEVVQGLQPIHSSPPTPNLTKQTPFQQQQLEEQKANLELQKQQHLKEQKRKLLDAAGFGTDIFANVEPMQEAVESNNSQAGALSGVDPQDPGVDITGIMAIGGRNWGKMI